MAYLKMQLVANCVFCFFFLIVCERIAAQETSSSLFDDPQKITQWIRENKVPALGIGVIKDGKLREVRVFGDLKKDNPAPYNTIFNVASLTKPVISMLTLKLVSRGQWQLDEPLDKYWIDPDVKNDPRHKKLTTRHVLSHQTGFVNWRWLHKSGKLTFDYEPGTHFGYSGEGFEYLRKALERKFNKPIEQLTDSIIFSPLGMTDTQHAWDKRTDESRFAMWHDTSGIKTYENFKTTSVNAADDLLTTIEDYGKFSVDVLQGAGLSRDLYKEMISSQVPTNKGVYMGLGWEVFPAVGPRKEPVITHSGSDQGVKTLVILLPVLKAGLIIMTNGDNGYKLYEKIIVSFLDVGKEMMEKAN